MDGYLASVVSKNKSATGSYPAGLLQANLTASADGYAGYLLVNNSRSGATCWINTITSGSAVLTNPFVSNVPTFNPSPNQVDTFANGDAFSIYQPTKIYVSGFLQGVEIGNVTFAHLWFIDPVSVGSTTVLMPFSFSCMETRLDVLLVFDTIGITGSSGSNLVNSWCNGNVSMSKDTSIIGGGTGAGYVGVNIFDFTSIDGDVIIQGNTGFNSCQIGSAYIDNSNLVILDNVSYINGDLLLDASIGTNYQFGLYGKYVLGFSNEVSKLTYLNGTAIQWFGGTPTFLMDGVSFANTYDRSVDPAVWYPARPLTVANLDLPVIQGGFGGLAIGDSGYIINNGVQTSSIVTPNLSFFVDPSNVSGHASDGYDGLTSSTPILTITEFNRRYRHRLINTATIVTFMSNVLSGDSSLDLSTVTLTSTGTLLFAGTPQVKHTGTLTSGTISINPLTNQRQILEDTGLGVNGWDGYVGDIITNNVDGYDAWIVKVDGISSNDKAFASRGYNYSAITIGGYNSGDTYQVSTGSDMKIGNISPKIVLSSSFTVGSGQVTFQDFNFLSSNAVTAPIIIDDVGMYFIRCKFGDPFVSTAGSSLTTLHNCYIGNNGAGAPSNINSLLGFQSTSPGGIQMNAGVWQSYAGDFATYIALQFDVYVTGWGVSVDRATIIDLVIQGLDVIGFDGGAQFQDCINPASAIDVSLSNGLGSTGATSSFFVWGSGNLGYGITINGGVTVTTGNTNLLTGTLGDFAFATNTGRVTTGRAWDETGAVWTSSRSTTWTNFSSSIAGGGFNYNAHNVATNSAIIGFGDF
jgi:hypothetical protein